MTDVNKLQEMLREKGASALLVSNPDDLHSAREESKRIPRTTHPTFQGMKAHLFLDISDEHIPLVREELEKMGISLEVATPIWGEDYLCPQCDYHSVDRGMCPTHRTPLVDFSTWNARRNKGVDRKSLLFWVGIFLLIAIAYNWDNGLQLSGLFSN